MAPNTRRNKKQNNKELTQSDSSDEEVENSNFTTIFNKMQKQFKLQEKAINKIHDSQKYINDSFEELRNEIKRVTEENKKIKKELSELRAQNSSFKTKLSKMQHQMTVIKQKENKNNLIITNLPKIEKEELHNLIIKLGQQVDAEIERKDIIDVYQNVNKKHNTYPVIARMNNENFKTKAMKFRKEQGIIDMKKIFPNIEMRGKNINFHHLLEKELSELLHKTKNEAKSKQYKFVWVKDGRILIRKDDHAATFEIESIEDLKKIK